MPTFRRRAGSRGPTVDTDRLWQTNVGGDLVFLLARAAAIARAKVNAALEEHDLTVRSYSVLELAVEGVLPLQRELAEFLRLDPSQIVTLIDSLESKGLIRRVPDPDDRRVNVLVATDAGYRHHRLVREVVNQVQSELTPGLSAGERSQLTSVLRGLAGARP